MTKKVGKGTEAGAITEHNPQVKLNDVITVDAVRDATGS